MIMFTLKMPYYTFDPYLMKLIGQISIGLITGRMNLFKFIFKYYNDII
jgi:hypothetical protein